MRPLIAVIDYEMGNLHSVAKALEKAGGRVQITSSPSLIGRAEAVVLPGVGAFGEAAKRLASKKLLSPIHKALERNKPFLGICLGLQLLFERSQESRGVKGLGFLKGDVVKFVGLSSPRRPNNGFKIPHMGWNTIQKGPAGKTAVLKGLGSTDYFYFVHSYYPSPRDASIIATRTAYGRTFCSSVALGRLFACQFHPEKSGDQGQRLLRNYVREVSSCS